MPIVIIGIPIRRYASAADLLALTVGDRWLKPAVD